nr:hypothetical protein GCM10020185_38020 [Pseudomonas brassicacearum subsp. brassicacearum]
MTVLQNLWLTETIRLREEHAGPLEDQEANRLARAAGGDLATRIRHRARWLAERDGLTEALRHWLQGARLALIALALLAVISGAGLGFAALGNGQAAVNVFWALGSLLGLNLILLIGWALGLIFAGEQGATLGRLWLWLSEKNSPATPRPPNWRRPCCCCCNGTNSIAGPSACWSMACGCWRCSARWSSSCC